MKSILCLLVLCASAVYQHAYGSATKEISHRLKAIVKKCDNVGLTEAHIVAVIEHREVPMNHAEDCIAACTFRELGTLQNGEFNFDAVRKVSKETHQNETENWKKLNAVEEACAAKAKDLKDDCEKAGSVLRCIHNETEAAHIPTTLQA